MFKNIINSLSRILIVALAIVTVLQQSPLYALDEMFTIGNQISQYRRQEACTPATNDISSTNLATKVTVVQANIKKTSSSSVLKAALQKIIAKDPDFVSLNEMHAAPRSAITPAGYELYKDPSAIGEERSTAVLWKKEVWTKIDAGRLLLVAKGPQKWDKGRSATWVTLKNSGGEVATMISVHQMINPRYHGPDIEKRQEIYKSGMEKLTVKIKELSANGTVFVAGDFNSRYPDNDPWGPEKMLGDIGMKSTFDDTKPVSTHQGGGTIDYIFHPDNVKTLSQSTIDSGSLSDHLFLVATMQGTASGGDINAPLSGTPRERAWDLFTRGGLTPEQAAGIMGNIETESHFDPQASNAGNYLGIAQWDAVSRWPRLKDWAASQKPKPLDPLEFNTQLRYLWKEASDRGNIEGIKKYSDVEHTAWYWGRFFEGAVINGSTSEVPLTNVQDLEGRTTNARSFLDGPLKFPSTTSTATSSTCSDSSSVSPGEGNFSDNGEVTDFNVILKNATLTNSIYGSSLVESGYCAAITARVTSGSNFGNHTNKKYGTYNASAVSMWYEHEGDELAHADRQPPKGAWLFYEHYDTSPTDDGHVVLYLGNNKILNDGQLVDANLPEKDWGLKYLGWIDPTKAGFSVKSLSESDLHTLLDEYRRS